MSLKRNAINYIRKNVNLHTYSKSKKFLGHYELLKKRYGKVDIENVIRLLKIFSTRLGVLAKLEVFDGLSKRLKKEYNSQYADILCDEFITLECNLNIVNDREKVYKILGGIFDGVLFGHVFFYFKKRSV